MKTSTPLERRLTVLFTRRRRTNSTVLSGAVRREAVAAKGVAVAAGRKKKAAAKTAQAAKAKGKILPVIESPFGTGAGIMGRTKWPKQGSNIHISAGLWKTGGSSLPSPHGLGKA